MVKKLFKKLRNIDFVDNFIFDENGSHRSIDNNGRMLVNKTLITKACVSDYYGKEIPNYEALGLEPFTKYSVLRPAEELEKALPLFNNIPLLNKHIMDYADEPHKENRCGGLSNCVFEDDAVYADLNVWDKEDIDNIENGTLKDLSCGYRCNFVQESGEYNGKHYDLKMVDIMPNHLALVKKGRVDGAYVFDENKQGDSEMVEKLAKLLTKLGIKDEDIKELAKEEVKAEPVKEEPAKAEPAKDEEHAKPEDKRKLIDEIGGILKGKVDEELLRTILGKAEKLAYEGSEKGEESEESKLDDEEKPEIEKGLEPEIKEEIKAEVKEEEPAKAEPVKEEPAKDEEPVKEEPAKEPELSEEEKLKKVKDEAKAEAKKEFENLEKAKKEVEDVCGKVGTQDSVEQYYKIGCQALGIKTDGIMDSAFEPMFKGALAMCAKKAVILDGKDGKEDKADKANALEGLNLLKRNF